MRTIHAIGGQGKRLLPAYSVEILPLRACDTVIAGDLLLLGADPHYYHAWVPIAAGSEFVGRIVQDVCGGRRIIGRIVNR